MPLNRLLLILAAAIIAASLTLWAALLIGGTAGLPPLWAAITGVLALSLILRLVTRR